MPTDHDTHSDLLDDCPDCQRHLAQMRSGEVIDCTNYFRAREGEDRLQRAQEELEEHRRLFG